MSLHAHGMDIPPARPRPRPQKPQNNNMSRESGAVRESVLEVAMQLGLGVNPAVADWMFNNQLKEEDEDLMPGLTHSEESPGSSPLSGRYPPTPSSPPSQDHSSDVYHAQRNPGNFHFLNANTVSSEFHSPTPHVPDAANVPRPSTPSKLKKKRSANRIGYESDSGTLSDSKRKKDKKKEKKEKGKQIDAALVPPMPFFASSSVPSSSANSFLTLETASDMTIDSSDPWRRTKPMAKASLISRSEPASPFDFPGYETDGSRKSKKKSKKHADGDNKDVKWSRSLFFRLGTKSSKGDLKKENSMPSAVQMGRDLQPPPLPIAERFATTLNKETGAPMIALAPRAPQSSGNGSMPGSGLEIDFDMFTTSPAASAPPPRTKTPTRPRTAESATPFSTINHTLHPPVPALAIPHLHSTSPPVSFSPSSSPAPPRPGSAGTSRTSTSTNTNTHSYSTGAARTSSATSVSTSHSQNVKGVTLSREASKTDVPSLISPSISGPVPAYSVPPTPNKRRVLPFLGTQATRSSASSGDSLEKEKKREEKGREKERKGKEKEREKERKGKEKEREKEKGPKKPSISLPLTRDTTEAMPASATLTRNPSMTTYPITSLSVPNTPLRTKPNGGAVEGPFGVGSTHALPRALHPPVSHHFQNHRLSRQLSLSHLQSQGQFNYPLLTRQVSLTALRPAGSSNGDRPSPNLVARSIAPTVSGRTSPMLRGPGMNGIGSPSSGSRLSALQAPPNIFVHHDMPPPSPPPLAPLPSVPTNASPFPPPAVSPPKGAHQGDSGASSDGHLTVDVGIAVTTGSPLPSPLLVSSPSYNDTANDTSKVPPTSFNPSSAAAGSALRAKVQRRLSQQDGFPTPASGANANGRAVSPTSSPSPVSNAPPSTVPVIHAPAQSLSRGMSLRGRESPFPALPFGRNSPHPPNNTLTVNHLNTAFPPRAMSPRSGWEDSNSEQQSTVADEDDDGMEDVLARFRESRVHNSSRKGMHIEAGDMMDGVTASFQQGNGGSGGAPSILSNWSLNGNAPVSPSPSSNVMVPVSPSVMGLSVDSPSGRYDSFTIDEYYGHGSGGGVGNAAEPSATAPEEDDDPLYDDYDPEDASHYPEDEMSYRRSRRGRSTVYASDDDHDNLSNNGHGHSGGKGRSSRYSGSIYSRGSFLDNEKSGEARQRFLKHVEAMLGERSAVPPVPKLPEEFVAESKRAAATAKKEHDQMVMQRTVGVGARKVPAGSGRPVSPGL